MPRTKRVIGNDNRDGGLECPSCGGRRHRVSYVRHQCDGSIFRLRVCDHCGRRMPTRERLV